MFVCCSVSLLVYVETCVFILLFLPQLYSALSMIVYVVVDACVFAFIFVVQDPANRYHDCDDGSL